jgi:catechol-2,3-dioxygenase
METILTARERGKIAPVRFEHAGLRTTRLQDMVRWYCTVLQADVSFENKSIAFLAFDERNHRLVLINRPGTTEPVPSAAGLDHLAFAYADLSELADTYRRLRDDGIIPTRTTDHGSSISFYYLDPDGNQVELKVDTITEPAAQYAWLRSEDFKNNPLGTPIDPEQL